MPRHQILCRIFDVAFFLLMIFKIKQRQQQQQYQQQEQEQHKTMKKLNAGISFVIWHLELNWIMFQVVN